MIDLREVFLEAWGRVKPRLDADDGERRARLARWGAVRLGRPLREWCIAVRANDLRITPMRAAIVPEGAPAAREEHSVTLDRGLLLALHHPVEVDFPHSRIPEMARRMGVTEAAVRRLVKRGDLRQRRIKGFGHRNDRWGGIPFVSGDGAFDPNFGARMRRPDAVWGGWWQDLARDVPEDFAQVVRRVPEVHDDWRPSPRSTKGHPDRNRPRAELAARGRAEGFRPTPRFWGWRWVCPGCGETCRHLYLPRPFPLPPCFDAYLREHLGEEAMEEPPASFACGACHGVQARVSWAVRGAWNQVVCVVSGGLLYGNEVRVPAWLKRERRGPKVSRGPREAPGRREVEERLVMGWTDREIAADLGIQLQTVRNRVGRARRFWGVRTRVGLVEMLRGRVGEVRGKSAG